MFLILVLLIACIESTVGKRVIYEGNLVGNYKSSDDFVKFFNTTKECMGITNDVPLPMLRVMDDKANKVMCGAKVKDGCFQPPDLIVLPINSDTDIIKCEMVHYLLQVTTGDLDANHNSKYFELCGSCD